MTGPRRSESTAREKREEEEQLELASVDSKKIRDGQEGRERTAHSEDMSLAPVQSNRKSLKSVRSRHSQAGADGYTYFANSDDDEERQQQVKRSAGDGKETTAAPDEPYLVRFDGDTDPMNPRSMAKWRRWVIVLIVASSSLCV